MSYQIFLVLHESVSKESTLEMNNSPTETLEKRQLYCWGRSLHRKKRFLAPPSPLGDTDEGDQPVIHRDRH